MKRIEASALQCAVSQIRQLLAAGVIFKIISFRINLDKFRLNEYNIIRIIVYAGCKMENYMTVKDAAIKWKVTERQVQILCKTNRIEGAVQVSRIWLIPSNAVKPTRQ